MCDMVTLGGKDNGLQPENCNSASMSSVLDLSPFDLKINREHLPLMWVDHMCVMVTLGGKDNGPKPGNRISTLMSSALDL